MASTSHMVSSRHLTLLEKEDKWEIKPGSYQSIRFHLDDVLDGRYLYQVIEVKSGRVIISINVRVGEDSSEACVVKDNENYKPFEALLSGTNSFCTIIPRKQLFSTDHPVWLNVTLKNPLRHHKAMVQYKSQGIPADDRGNVSREHMKKWLRDIMKEGLEADFITLMEELDQLNGRAQKEKYINYLRNGPQEHVFELCEKYRLTHKEYERVMERTGMDKLAGFEWSRTIGGIAGSFAGSFSLIYTVAALNPAVAAIEGGVLFGAFVASLVGTHIGEVIGERVSLIFDGSKDLIKLVATGLVAAGVVAATVMVGVMSLNLLLRSVYYILRFLKSKYPLELKRLLGFFKDPKKSQATLMEAAQALLKKALGMDIEAKHLQYFVSFCLFLFGGIKPSNASPKQIPSISGR